MMDQKTFFEKLNMGQLSSEISSLFPELSIDFSELLEMILKGNIMEAGAALLQGVGQNMQAQFAGMKQLLVILLLIGVLSALCAVLMQTFQNKQIADVAHFISYLLMLTVVLAVFGQAAETAQQLLERIVRFVKVLVPVFMLALGLASGTATAVGYYQLILVVLFLAQQFLLKAGIPAVKVFLLLNVMNGIWDEDRLTPLVELLKKGISGVLKFFLTTVAGIGVLQSMVTPVLERLRIGTAGKALSAIPGLGGLAEGTAQLLLGSAVLIKNGLGVVAILLLIFCCAAPVCRIFLWAGILKLCAGLMGLAADKRLTACVNGAGDALFLILRIIFTVAACFLIMFAIIVCLAGMAA